MADYIDLRKLINDSDLLERTEVAIIIAANGLADNAPNNAWVADAYTSTTQEAKKALKGIIAQNSGATVANIQSATDSALQSNVDAVVSTLVKAKAST